MNNRAEYQKLYMREWRAKRKADKGPSPLEAALAVISELEEDKATLNEMLTERVEWAGKLQDGLTMIVTRLAGNDRPLAVELRKIAEEALG